MPCCDFAFQRYSRVIIMSHTALLQYCCCSHIRASNSAVEAHAHPCRALLTANRAPMLPPHQNNRRPHAACGAPDSQLPSVQPNTRLPFLGICTASTEQCWPPGVHLHMCKLPCHCLTFSVSSCQLRQQGTTLHAASLAVVCTTLAPVCTAYFAPKCQLQAVLVARHLHCWPPGVHLHMCKLPCHCMTLSVCSCQLHQHGTTLQLHCWLSCSFNSCPPPCMRAWLLPP
jgi:hypothetical protein